MSLSHKITPWKGDVMGLSSMSESFNLPLDVVGSQLGTDYLLRLPVLSVWTHAGGFQRKAPLVPSLQQKASALPQLDTDTLLSGGSNASVDDVHASNVDSSIASSDSQLILDLIESWVTRASKQ